MAKRKTPKAKEEARLSARPVFNKSGDITNWEVTNGVSSVVAKSETAAINLLNASVAKNLGRYIVIAEHVGADGKVKLCRRYERKGKEVTATDLPVAATTPKAATANTRPAAPGQRVATGKTPAKPAPAAKTGKTPKSGKVNPGLAAYQKWKKAFLAATPGATKAQIKAAWKKHKNGGKTPTATAKTGKTPKAPAAKTGKTPKAKTGKTPKAGGKGKINPGLAAYNKWAKGYKAAYPNASAADVKAAWAKHKGEGPSAKTGKTPKAKTGKTPKAKGKGKGASRKAAPKAKTELEPLPPASKTPKAQGKGKGKTPKAKTGTTPKKAINPGLAAYNKWAKGFRSANPNATPKQVKAAWAQHKG